MLQNNEVCQEKAVEQTFVVDSSRLLSFAVGYVSDLLLLSYLYGEVETSDKLLPPFQGSA